MRHSLLSTRKSGETVSRNRQVIVRYQPDIPDTPKKEGGLKVLSIHQASQLEGLLQPGFTLLEINEKPVATEMEAAKAVVDGENQIVLINNQGEKSKYSVNMKPGPLHIQFEA